MSSSRRKARNEAISSLPHPHSIDESEMECEQDYSPLPWSQFFDRKDDIHIGADTFRAYFRGSSGPLLFLLHGAGHSALSWAMFAVEMTKLMQCQVFSVDLRGHGNTFTEYDEELSVEVLVNDIARVFTTVYGNSSPSPEVVLIGHSMGGAIAVKAAAANVIPSLVGLSVIDVVEGTAIKSLSGAQRILQNRPNTFSSLSNAIEWSIKSKHLRNLQSARVSMPGQLKRLVDKKLGAADKVDCAMDSTYTNTTQATIVEDQNVQDRRSALVEMKKECYIGGDYVSAKLEEDDKQLFTWRTNLSLTASYWRGWFLDLSNVFLLLPVPKLLIVAGVDRLDKTLTVGHMQGKFQLSVMPMSGHVIHEDVPNKVADTITAFMARYRLATKVECDKPRLLQIS